MFVKVKSSAITPRQPSVPKRMRSTAIFPPAVVIFQPDDVLHLGRRDFQQPDVFIRRAETMDHAGADRFGRARLHPFFPPADLQQPAAAVGVDRFMLETMVLPAEPVVLADEDDL